MSSLTKESILTALKRGPATADELVGRLELDQKGRHRLTRLLRQLIDTGAAARAPGKKSRAAGWRAPPPPAAAVVGRIRVHPAGYGFVERDDGEADVFVPARFRGTALDGDRV